MPAGKVSEYLERNGVEYECIHHPVAYTAQEVAAASHVKGRAMAKVVMVRVDGELMMVAAPAAHHIDLEQIRRLLDAMKVELAAEEEFADLFPDCEVGAMPPLGRLYNLRLLADDTLMDYEEIAFNAGTHNEVMKMHFADFARLEAPRFGSLVYNI